MSHVGIKGYLSCYYIREKWRWPRCGCNKTIRWLGKVAV